MPITIKTGNLSIYETGSVITYNNQPVDFLFETLFFRFQFESDNSSQPSIKVAAIPSIANSLTIILVNYDNEIALGNSQPLSVGTLNGQRLFLNFRVFNLKGKADKIIHFTWYKELQ